MLHQTFDLAFSRRTMLRSSAVMGAGAAAMGLPLGAAAYAQSAGGAWPRVREMVDSYAAQGKVAGLVAALGWQQQQPEFIAAGTRTFGGNLAVDADSLFRIYSMTKPITGMATMMCIDDGLIALDQPLSEVLPAFANMRVQRSYDGPITSGNLEPAVRPITIRHLLTHTAGLGYTIIQQGPIRDAYIRDGIVPAYISRLELAQQIFGGTPAASLADFADGLAELPLVYQPGTRWSYSVSLDLLGRVIEVATGMAFDQFLQRRIFDPVGMTSTWFRVPASQAQRLTGNYFFMGGMPLPVDLPSSSVFLDQPAFPFGGAGLVSSPRDYDRFLQMLAGFGTIDGTQVMSEAAVRLGASDLLPDTLAADGGFSTAGRAFGYGAGGLVGRGETAGMYGWFGAAGTTGLVNLTHGLRHSLMTQYMPAETWGAQSDFPVRVAQDAAAQLQG